MTSWRDSASQEAQDDFDELLNAVLPFALESAERRGEFYPFGATVSIDGAVTLTASHPGFGENPLSNDVLALLIRTSAM